MSETIRTKDLADELGVDLADVLVLVDQLIDIDGSDATLTESGEILPAAAECIREQLHSTDLGVTYTISVSTGAEIGQNGRYALVLSRADEDGPAAVDVLTEQADSPELLDVAEAQRDAEAYTGPVNWREVYHPRWPGGVTEIDEWGGWAVATATHRRS